MYNTLRRSSPEGTKRHTHVAQANLPIPVRSYEDIAKRGMILHICPFAGMLQSGLRPGRTVVGPSIVQQYSTVFTGNKPINDK
ncbi:hypothetical protein PHLCEN_2v3649 [Hermanssonia centrifuga]|uniref:Uncharacterized protein n=1 Tax=Hermanssonia centrifuga TaxID=98765 RepID=A0A2R6QEQ4_9APHY|nr:hypothetical protein PHLCEN_2v3649 [Hermanssonia centrifuga]